MAEINLVMPEMGESVTDATIGNWLVSEGDHIKVDQDLLEVSTDKVDTEVPSPVNGIIKQILHKPGEVVEVGKPLAIIEVENHESIQASPAINESAQSEFIEQNNEEELVTEDVLKHPEPPYLPNPKQNKAEKKQSLETERFYSPLVRRMAQAEQISMQELKAIKGSGVDGRVTKDDMASYIQQRNQKNQDQNQKQLSVRDESIKQSERSVTEHSITIKPGDEIVEMDRMRKLIAEHMVQSVKTSPHATLFIEADVTNLVTWRNKMKKTFQHRENQKLTFTPLFVHAITKAIKAYPGLNVSVVNESIHYKKNINIGMATALPNGNLIVPVIKHTSDKTISALAKDVNDLANRARNKQLNPEDTQGGTFTITNIGTFGNLMGTPIINQPQVAILAIGSIKKKPVVIETKQGDMIGIRQMMYLSLTMDHRVVDGAMGGAFLKKVVEELENWDTEQEI